MTAFFQRQELSSRNQTFTIVTWRSPHSSSLRSNILTKAAALRLTVNIDGTPNSHLYLLDHTLTHHTLKDLVYQPRLYL